MAKLKEASDNTQLRIDIFKEAIRMTRALIDEMPSCLSPQFSEWETRYNAQRAANDEIAGELAAVIGREAVVEMLFDTMEESA